jgi:hypothetical protein
VSFRTVCRKSIRLDPLECAAFPRKSSPVPNVRESVRGVPVPDLGSRGFRLIDEGNLVNAGQQTGIASNVLIVPAEVVQHGQNGLYVFIVDDQNRA